MTGVLTTSGLTRQFGGLTAVEDVSVVFPAGEVACVIGPNGAGKSTFLNMICGAIAPSRGTISFDGRSIQGLSRHAIARAGIARKFQVPSFFRSLTVAENLAVAGQGDLDSVLAQIGLQAERDTQAAVLAHGQTQWLEIGMALIRQPKLLLLDEPTAGLSPEETQAVARLILSLRGQTTVVVIDHDMHFVRALSARTVVMHQGRLVAEGTFAHIERDPMVRDIYLGRG
jgi:ABC-type uncharacterized transport system ATPase subunit